jgi:hypothetical protein
MRRKREVIRKAGGVRALVLNVPDARARLRVYISLESAK